MSIELTDEQEKVADVIAEWYRRRPRNGPPMTVGGLAGVGKTVLANALPERLGVKRWRIAFCAFTGKAASRLKDPKGEPTGRTIHRLIYHPDQRHCQACPKRADPDRACHRKAPEKPADRLCVECDLTPRWRRVSNLPYDLVIVDEASMVSEAIYKDLSSFGVPVVWIGDHGQLPPVKGNFNLMANPAVKLETIHRQLAGSPILRLAMQARETGRIPFGLFGPGVQKRRADGRWSTALNAELVLCGRNDTRVALNRAARALREHPPGRPAAGDRLICLRNDYDNGTYNGTQGQALSVEDGGETWSITVLIDGGAEVEVAALKAQFGQLTTTSDAPRGIALWDYGYALTVHKSQGSEADQVVLLEQPIGDPRRWLYTGVTRAKRQLEIIAH